MASLSPRQAAGNRRPALWWTSYASAAVVALATLALIALGQFLGWGTAITGLLTAAPANTVVRPSPTPETLPSAEDLTRERGELMIEVAQLREELVAMQQARAAASVVEGFEDSSSLVTARVIHKDPYKVLPSFILDVGSSDGVKRGQPVLGQAGVVGRVAQVWPGRCRIDLLSAPGVAFGALVQTSRAMGVVQSQGKELKLDYVAKTSPVGIGDLVVTSGVPGLTPQGLPVGIVASVVKENEGLTLEVIIQPLEDPWVLEVAQVVLATGEPSELTEPERKGSKSKKKQSGGSDE